MSGPRSILIIRLSSLGDILHTLPAFEGLRRSFPEARIDWLVEKRMQHLLSVVPGIDAIMPVDLRRLRDRPTSTAGWRDTFRILGRLRSNRYDLALDFQGLLKTAVLIALSGAETRAGFSRELVRERPAHWFYNLRLGKQARPLHITRQNRLLAEAAGAQPTPFELELRPDPDDVAKIETRLRLEQLSGFIVINPGGGWPTKRWQPAKYGILADRLCNELKVQVVVITGPGEGHLYEELADHCMERKPVHIEATFLQLIPLLRKSRLLVGGDTGPFHLACALRVPVVGIFGPTLPARNGPWNETDEVVVHELPCSFCNGRTCPTRNECMEIPVEEVLEAIKRRLGRVH